MAFIKPHLPFIFIILASSFHASLSQTDCNGVFLSYNYTGGRLIPPRDLTNQAYRFESTITLLNRGFDELKSWRVFVGFRYNEFLVSATNAVLADGSSLPAAVGNGTVFAGFPETDLKSAIQTAGDENQMRVDIQLVGTQFGANETEIPLPDNLTLVNDGYSCQNFTKQGDRIIHLCCLRDLSSKPNSSFNEVEFLPRQDGDLTIMYDVIRSYESNYWAQVEISNHNPIGRLDNWKLSWEWMRDEFIHSMKGAYPVFVDTTNCIFNRQGQHYKDMDFSAALSCETNPTIIDLPPTRANDTNIGLIPFCCRNGTILPPSMDPSKSISVFQMQVYKMPPDLNRTVLIPPQNWKINGTVSSNYQCGSPIRVSPSRFPDPSGLSSKSTAIASWQVVCNITRAIKTSPSCCVSFSAFFNDTAVPCSTCACGCSNNPSQTCNATAPALLPRPQDLLVPFDNRTTEVVEWARDKRWPVPNPLPCGDNCGVSINWHLLSDYRNGWTARITIFNWDKTDFPDWFAAVELDKAGPGFEAVYSFNGSALPGFNDTIFMQGVSGLNYLVAERDGKNPKKDPRVPGMQQSVIGFTKKKTPNIDVVGGDGYPSKVYFNGHECALPPIRPTSSSRMSATTSILNILSLLLAAIVLLLIQC